MHPQMLKLYIYRIRSSRRLEAETHCNIEMIWLLRHLKPGFKAWALCRLLASRWAGTHCHNR
jgi:transposase